jgi:hypothetical protein
MMEWKGSPLCPRTEELVVMQSSWMMVVAEVEAKAWSGWGPLDGLGWVTARFECQCRDCK